MVIKTRRRSHSFEPNRSVSFWLTMRVTFCSEYFHPDAGATGKVMHQLVYAACRDNPDIEATVITGTRHHRQATTRDANSPGNLNVVAIPTPGIKRTVPIMRLLGDIAYSFATLVVLIRRPLPELVVVVTNPFTLPGVVWAFSVMFRIPYVYIVHDLYPDIAVSMGVADKQSVGTRMLRRLQRQWLGRAAKVIALGRCMKERIRRDYRVSEATIQVIPNWADLDLSHQATQSLAVRDENPAFREKHGLSGFIVTYAGNFGRFHDFDTILDSAHTLGSVAPDVTLLFVGGGAQEDHIRRRVENETLGNVRIIPFVERSELPSLMRSTDVAIVSLTEDAEGLAVPLKFYNLLAAGLPVIAVLSPKSEISMVIAEARCGIRVDQSDTASFVQAVLDMRCNHVLRRQMSENASKAAVAKYPREEAIRAYVKAFREACATVSN